VFRWLSIARQCVGLAFIVQHGYSPLPGARTCDAFEMMVILNAMFEVHTAGRFATASALARSTGISRSTVQRRMGELTKLGAIERNGETLQHERQTHESPRRTHDRTSGSVTRGEVECTLVDPDKYTEMKIRRSAARLVTTTRRRIDRRQQTSPPVAILICMAIELEQLLP